MRTFLSMSATAALLLAAHAAHADSRAVLDGYYGDTELEIEGVSGDGDTFGARLWVEANDGIITAQYQSGELETRFAGSNVDVDVENLRVGLGGHFLRNDAGAGWMRAEYVDFDVDVDVDGSLFGSDSQDGIGAHVGGRIAPGGAPVNLYGEAGYLWLDDLEGTEVTVGASWMPSNIGAFVEYRITDLELDDSNVEEEIKDLRIGIRFVLM